MKYSEKVHDLVDDLVLSSADAQLILIIAFGASFYSISQCSVLLYHYYVAFHIVLVGLVTSVLAFVLVRSPYKSYFSSLARIVLFGISIATLLQTKDVRMLEDNDVAAMQGHLPTETQKDSLIILPAYCILERSVNPFFNLTDDQKRPPNE